MAFTRNKDIDRKILIDIEHERDFLALCSTEKYVRELCNSYVYRERLRKHYLDIFKNKPPLEYWKLWYLQNMKAIGELKEKHGFVYKTGVPITYLSLLDRYDKKINFTIILGDNNLRN